MEPEVRERFERIENDLARVAATLSAIAEAQQHADARMAELAAAQQRAEARMDIFDRQLRATRNLMQAGMRIMVDMQMKIDSLIDSQTRLYGAVLQLAEAQKTTETRLQALIDSLQKGGDGRR